jgi:hypothetical protein
MRPLLANDLATVHFSDRLTSGSTTAGACAFPGLMKYSDSFCAEASRVYSTSIAVRVAFTAGESRSPSDSHGFIRPRHSIVLPLPLSAVVDVSKLGLASQPTARETMYSHWSGVVAS